MARGRCFCQMRLYAQVRNERGRELLDSLAGAVETSPTMSAGSRREFVMQTAIADDEAKMGRGPDPMPRWLGTILAWVLEKVRPCPAVLGRMLAFRWISHITVSIYFPY